MRSAARSVRTMAHVESLVEARMADCDTCGWTAGDLINPAMSRHSPPSAEVETGQTMRALRPHHSDEGGPQVFGTLCMRHDHRLLAAGQCQCHSIHAGWRLHLRAPWPNLRWLLISRTISACRLSDRTTRPRTQRPGLRRRVGVFPEGALRLGGARSAVRNQTPCRFLAAGGGAGGCGSSGIPV